MGESFSRAGGLHSYVRGLSRGQRMIGKCPVIVDNVSRKGEFGVASGDLVDARGQRGVVHYHFAYTAWPFVKRMGCDAPWSSWPAILHFHGPWFLEARAQGQSVAHQVAKYFWERRAIRKFPKFIAASDAFAQVLTRNYSIDRARVDTVLPGVDIERFSPGSRSDARSRLGLPTEGKWAVTVRRLEPRMGLEHALGALQSLPDWNLAVVGTGSLGDALKVQARSLGLEERVRFLGRVSDEALPDVYRAANVSVVPTTALEGFGMIVLESFAAGTPAVATNIGGLPEAMGPFARDFCVEPANPESLAERIAFASTDTSLPADVRTFAEGRSFTRMAMAVEDVINDRSRLFNPEQNGHGRRRSS